MPGLPGCVCSGTFGPTATTSSTAGVRIVSSLAVSTTVFPDLNVIVLTDLRPVTPLVLTTRSPSLRDESNSSTTLNLISSSLTSSVNVNSGFPG